MPLNVMSASDMGIGEAGLTAIFGYVVVFVGLLLLMVVLYIMGAVFKSKAKKAEALKAAEQAAGSEPHTPAEGRRAHAPRPDNAEAAGEHSVFYGFSPIPPLRSPLEGLPGGAGYGIIEKIPSAPDLPSGGEEQPWRNDPLPGPWGP